MNTRILTTLALLAIGALNALHAQTSGQYFLQVWNGTGFEKVYLTPAGSGGLVLSVSPSLVTPDIGAATATSINGLTITASTGTLTLSNGKTATISNTLTFSGTDGSTLNIGTGGTLGTMAYQAAASYTGSASIVTIGTLTSGTVPGARLSGAYTSAAMTMSTARLLGRTTASSGAVEEISISTGLTMSGGALAVTNPYDPAAVAITGGTATGLTQLSLSSGTLYATGRFGAGVPAIEFGGGIGIKVSSANGMQIVSGGAAEPVSFLGGGNGPTVQLAGNATLAWHGSSSGGNNSDGDLLLGRDAAAVLQQGKDSATPIDQTIKAPDGVGSNITGAAYTIAGGNGTGAGPGGVLNFNTAPPGSSGSSPNTPTIRASIDSAGVWHIYDADAAPGSSPASGGYFYSEGGALKWRSAGGTVTTIAPN